MQKETIAIITAIVMATSLVFWSLERLHDDVNRLEDRTLVVERGLVETQGSLQGFLEALVEQGKEDPPKATSSTANRRSNQSSSSGNDVTETVDYLAETPKRIGKEAERALKKIKDLF